MLSFFRKIRRQLAKENKFYQYSRYAIGEILLVVVGILIALQINNWNEERKDRIREKEILNELIRNIEYNNEHIANYIVGKERYNAYSDYVIAVLDGAIPYSDSLDNVLNLALLNRDNFFFSEVAYESLKSMGVELIRNNALKNEIVKLFDDEYVTARNSMGWTRTEMQQNYMDQHFLPISGDNRLILRPYDFSAQVGDPYFRSIIEKAKIQRNFYASRLKGTLEESKVLLSHLQQELNHSD